MAWDDDVDELLEGRLTVVLEVTGEISSSLTSTTNVFKSSIQRSSTGTTISKIENREQRMGME